MVQPQNWVNSPFLFTASQFRYGKSAFWNNVWNKWSTQVGLTIDQVILTQRGISEIRCVTKTHCRNFISTFVCHRKIGSGFSQNGKRNISFLCVFHYMSGPLCYLHLWIWRMCFKLIKEQVSAISWYLSFLSFFI